MKADSFAAVSSVVLSRDLLSNLSLLNRRQQVPRSGRDDGCLFIPASIALCIEASTFRAQSGSFVMTETHAGGGPGKGAHILLPWWPGGDVTVRIVLN